MKKLTFYFQFSFSLFSKFKYLFTIIECKFWRLEWLRSEFWTTSNVPGYFVGITKSSDAHSGSSSAKIELISYLNFPYPSSLTSINDDNSYGHPVSAKYTSLTGYLKVILNHPE